VKTRLVAAAVTLRNRNLGYDGKVEPPKVLLSPGSGCCNLLHTGSSPASRRGREGKLVTRFLHRLWSEEEGQDIAEYAVMLAVILVIVVGTVRLIGGNSNNVFSNVASSIGS
jgi:Flp pilus assembly pilin Flp